MKRFKQNLSHYKLLSCDMGELVPISCVDVLPGDTFEHSTTILLRVSPLVNPVMHPVEIRVHHWFVPYRIVWPGDQIDSGWEAFITGGDMDAVPPIRPFISLTNVVQGSLADYFGIPLSNAGVTRNVSALPFRAYAKIWNEYYRDQDVDTALGVGTADGADVTTSTVLQKCRWEKDYFTLARPWPQKGATVTVPLLSSLVDPIQVRSADAPSTDRALQVNNANDVIVSGVAPGATQNLLFGTNTGLNFSIDDLRESLALQSFAQARALYGSRYSEYLRYLGIGSSDTRLQRPEYLGGGKQTISFSEVLRTEGATTTGEMAGHGIAALKSNRYRKFFEEHGVVMTLMSVRPKSMYTEALNRMWTKTVREEYYQRELEPLGPQEIFRRELWCDPASAANDAVVFGYGDRYEEYRRVPSTVAAEMRTSTLNDWHLARTFAAAPALNSSFLECNPTKRVHAVQTNDVLWVMAYHKLPARRMIGHGGRVVRSI